MTSVNDCYQDFLQGLHRTENVIDEILNEAHMKNENYERTPHPQPYAAEIIEEDNKACIDASMTKRMRHLALTENFLKEKFADGTCILKKVDSKKNNADIGAKRLQLTTFEYLTYPLVDQSLREMKREKKSNFMINLIKYVIIYIVNCRRTIQTIILTFQQK